ncbi:MAG: vWA domain-containing protein [Planctomycetota bacterium]|jgi:hypothetical protein
MPPLLRVFNTLVLLACLAASPVAAQDAPSTTESLEDASEAERATIQALLGSQHWPFRVFGLLRLERYAAASIAPAVLEAVGDEVWQVRCFAYRAAARAGIEMSEADWTQETTPMGIRALVRHGVDVPEERLVRGTRVLLRSNDPEQFLLGVEIAGASRVESLRGEAARRLVSYIKRMNDVVAAASARRLGRVLEVDPAPGTADGWRAWLRSQDGVIGFPPPVELKHAARTRSPLVRDLLGDRTPVADMDAESFQRLIDYIDSLKQRDMDVVIAMDVTMSMLAMINEARVGVDDLILFLNDIARTMRLGFVAYRDHDNPPVTMTHHLTGDIASIREYLYGIEITGGADYPEAVYDGLAACRELDWNPRATRQVIVVGDAPPHARDASKLTSLLENARDAGTPVHAVHVPMRRKPGFYDRTPAAAANADRAFIRTHNADTEAAFREIARVSGGDWIKLEDARSLVPSIMHFSIAEPWWPAFDQFYGLYVDLCR